MGTQGLTKEHKEFATDFKLQLIGAVSEDVLHSIIKHQLRISSLCSYQP